MYKVLPLFKSHFSLGHSILTLEKPTGKTDSYPTSIFDLVINNKLDTMVLVEDSVSGLLQASKHCDENKIKLVFGLRLDVCESVEQKDEESLKKRATYIIFSKNSEGYKSLIKIWSFAAKEGFYYSPSIDFKNLKKFWNDNLLLVVPFYDSFLHQNSLCSHLHVPDFQFAKPTFLVENNELPFDDILKEKVENYCKINNYNILPAQSIFYKSSNDFIAYLTFRCVHGKPGAKKSTLDKPDLEHMGSDTFNFERWLVLNNT